MTTAVATEITLGPAGAIVGIRLEGLVTSPEVIAAEEGKEGDTGPNPIAPEGKELYWGAGSFLVLLVLMRFFLFPRVKRGMDERYQGVRADLEGADAVKSAARADVAAYQKALDDARAEAAQRIDAARQTLDSERQRALAEVNARISSMRGEADARTAASREAARGQIADAVGAVASRAAELATGKSPSADIVKRAVTETMESAGTR